jgi:uncharacterized protein
VKTGETETRRAGRLARWLMAAGGVISFVLGAVGIVVPGLPTTVFVLVGSYLLARSCPWIQERLLSIPIFRPYARYVDPTVPMPRPVKQRAIAAMWLFIGVAVLLMAAREHVRLWVPAIVLAAGVAGTVAILRFRRHLT